METASQHPTWEHLLNRAVSEPGRILEAYSAFHGYSLGNQLLALEQCIARGIEPGPINTFMGWKRLNRFVRKGQKAIVLCMPVTCKRSDDAGASENNGDGEQHAFTRFIFRPNWFVLTQTDGESAALPAVPEFDITRALASLNIARVEFSHLDGNAQGYARGREIAISPVAQMPAKTLFHECAHILLGHTAEHAMSDSEQMPRDIKEVEAESVALLCCATLNLPGVEYARGYIQHWLHGNSIPERSAQRIFKTADQLLKAGTGETGRATAEPAAA